MAEALVLVSLARLQELEGLSQSQNHRPESETTERQHQVNRIQHIRRQPLGKELGRENTESAKGQAQGSRKGWVHLREVLPQEQKGCFHK